MAVPRLGLAVVHGRSMEPTLRAGDRLLVRYHRLPRPGRIAVVRLPEGILAVKRVTARVDDGWWVERDNPHDGVDSARVGSLPDSAVVAVVVARLWPRPGVGHLGRPRRVRRSFCRRRRASSGPRSSAGG